MMRRLLSTLALIAAVHCAPVPAKPPSSRVVTYDAGTSEAICAPIASRQLGDHCRCAADCADPASTCLTEEVSHDPQGVCSASCFNGAACPTGYTCSETVCYQNCQTDADCKPQSYCTLGTCSTYCIANSDCLSGNCNTYSRRCLAAGETPEGRGVDALCAANEDCKSNNCVDGHCATGCSVLVGACPDDTVCELLSGDLGECLFPCTPPGPCASPDRRCETVSLGTPPACIPTSTTGCLGKAPSPTAGLSCGCDSDCDDGTRCLSEAFGHFPQGVCEVWCNTDSDCDPLDTCLLGICVARCNGDADCKLGRQCAYGGCFPYCLFDTDCASGTCDLYLGQCTPTPDAGGGVGATCAQGSDCKSGVCDTSVHSDGSCAVICSLTRPHCPDNAICTFPMQNGSLPNCALPCTTAADCPQATAVCAPAAGGIPSHCE